MNENVDKHLDELSRKVMRQAKIEQPSFDFTQNVMSRMESIKTSNTTTYVPLISKRTWFLIVTVLMVIFVFAFFGTSEINNSWLSLLNFDMLPEYSIPNPFANIEFSQTMFYALFLLATMICVQIPILKRYFDRRLDV